MIIYLLNEKKNMIKKILTKKTFCIKWKKYKKNIWLVWMNSKRWRNIVIKWDFQPIKSNNIC